MSAEQRKYDEMRGLDYEEFDLSFTKGEKAAIERIKKNSNLNVEQELVNGGRAGGLKV